MKLCAVIAFIISSICGTAQTTSKTYKQGGRFIEVITANGRHLETRVWESDIDYNTYQKHQQPKDGWLYGVGRATANPADKSEAYIKREAQDAALDQIIGLMQKKVQKFHQDVRTEGTRDGLTRDDKTWQDGMKYQIKGELPRVGFQYSYRIDNPNGTVTYVVGIGIDMDKADRIEKGLQDDATKADGERELDDKFNF